MALVPGLGPITALGLLGAAVLGAAGATIGATAGGKMENSVTEGLPEDEIFVYEDALRQGRSVVIVLAEDNESASLIRELLKMQGAESVDAAREQWWIGLRGAEDAEYCTAGGSVGDDLAQYRRGFEIAQFGQTGNQSEAAALDNLRHDYPEEYNHPPFRRGYERGRLHRQSVLNGRNHSQGTQI